MKKYILITDIGRDTDDTLALIILLYLHKIKKIQLLAIAVSGAKLENRAKNVLYWLSKYGIKDVGVISCLNEEFTFSPIDIDERNNKIVKDIDSNVCILPYNSDYKFDIENINTLALILLKFRKIILELAKLHLSRWHLPNGKKINIK